MSSNYHIIHNTSELPQGQISSYVAFYFDDEAEARQYAAKHTDRQIYWLTEQRFAVWYSPLGQAEAKKRTWRDDMRDLETTMQEAHQFFERIREEDRVVQAVQA